jgi:hypothetical protein
MKSLLASLAILSTAISGRAADGVQITQLDDRLRVEINGKLFTEYHFTNVTRPYFYPVLGPGDLAMTRQWPMESKPGEEHDHPHHRGLWYTHSKVDGVDFWNDKEVNGKFVSVDGASIAHRKFTAIKSGAQVGVIQSTDDWVDQHGAVLCTDERTVTFYAGADNERTLDFNITLRAPSDKPLVLGDDKDGAMAIRVAESMRVTKKDKSTGEGEIVLATGLRGTNAWGKRADWCDYSGPVEGKTVGVAIFDHPSNPNHPTWWHVRDYGLFAANPWGVSYFENKPKGTGAMTVEAGQEITFRYRFYFHEGDAQQAKIVQHYKEYCTP